MQEAHTMSCLETYKKHLDKEYKFEFHKRVLFRGLRREEEITKWHKKTKIRTEFFTDLSLWAGSVIESPCPYVCMCVCLS